MLSTHQTDDVAALCQHVLVLLEGRVHFVGRASELAAVAAGRVWMAPERQSGAALAWVTAEGSVRHIGTPPAGAMPVEPTVEDGYLMLCRDAGVDASTDDDRAVALTRRLSTFVIALGGAILLGGWLFGGEGELPVAFAAFAASVAMIVFGLLLRRVAARSEHRMKERWLEPTTGEVAPVPSSTAKGSGGGGAVWALGGVEARELDE